MAEQRPRNLKLAAVGAVAVKVLTRYPHLPYVSNVALTDIEVSDLNWQPGVKVAVRTPPIEGVALWAVEFGSPVRFKQNPSYVDMTTTAVVDGVTVEVGDLVSLSKAWELAIALGFGTVADMSEVEPARLLSLSAVKEGAA